MPNLRISAEVWLTVAQLEETALKGDKDKLPNISPKAIMQKLNSNNYYGFVRRGVETHISQHCVANRNPDPATYCMLVAVDDTGTADPKGAFRRLYRDQDGSPAGQRDIRKRFPDVNELPNDDEIQTEAKRLIHWWCDFQNLEDPIKTTRDLTKAELSNQIRLSGDVYPFLLKWNRGYLIDDVKALNIVGNDENGVTDRFKNRAVTIKVGYALSKFEELGLTEEFERYLGPHRTIKPSYRRLFEEHRGLAGQSNNLSDNLQAPRIADLHGPVRIKLSDHVYAFLAEYGQSLIIDEVNNFKLKDDADQSYHIRSLTVQIGFAISRIQNLGLYDEFEHFLPSEVDPRYLDLYTDYINTST